MCLLQDAASIHLYVAVDDPPEFFVAADDPETELGAEHGIANVINESGDNRPLTDIGHPLRHPPEAHDEVLKRLAVPLNDVVQVALG